MPLETLTRILDQAKQQNAYAIGPVCLGYEEARSYVEIGEELGLPVILQAGPGARAHIPLIHWAHMLRGLGEKASIPVAVHLDHGQSLDECKAALDAGFTSIMYDGSRNPISQNVETSAKIAEAAKTANASLEVEVGHVGYQGDPLGDMTSPKDLELMGKTIPDAEIAISVGNVHLQQSKMAKIDWKLLSECRAAISNDFVIHGGSGVVQQDRARMAKEFGVYKINIGTEIRQAAGAAMLKNLQNDFDKLAALTASAIAVKSVARDLMKAAWGPT